MCMFAFLANMQAAKYDDVTVDGVKYRAITDSTADASIAKISDVYRKVIYMKAPEYATLVACKDLVERKIKNNSAFSNVSVQFDFNPTSGF